MTKKRHGTMRSFTVPLAAWGGIAAGLAPTAQIALNNPTNPIPALQELARDFTGIDPATGTWNPQTLWRGLVPLLIGVGIHMGASKLGVNRAIGRARVPVLRV